MFENKVLRKIAVPKTDEVHRILHNKEFCNVYRMPNIGRQIK
jgi:hypothetical protein